MYHSTNPTYRNNQTLQARRQAIAAIEFLLAHQTRAKNRMETALEQIKNESGKEAQDAFITEFARKNAKIVEYRFEFYDDPIGRGAYHRRFTLIVNATWAGMSIEWFECVRRGPGHWEMHNGSVYAISVPEKIAEWLNRAKEGASLSYSEKVLNDPETNGTKFWTRAEDGTLVTEISTLQANARLENDKVRLPGWGTSGATFNLRYAATDRDAEGGIDGWRFAYQGQKYLVVND